MYSKMFNNFFFHLEQSFVTVICSLTISYPDTILLWFNALNRFKREGGRGEAVPSFRSIAADIAWPPATFDRLGKGSHYNPSSLHLEFFSPYFIDYLFLQGTFATKDYFSGRIGKKKSCISFAFVWFTIVIRNILWLKGVNLLINVV